MEALLGDALKGDQQEDALAGKQDQEQEQEQEQRDLRGVLSPGSSIPVHEIAKIGLDNTKDYKILKETLYKRIPIQINLKITQHNYFI